MNCREVSAFLVELVAGDLDPDVQQEFDVHLAACANCVAFLNQYRGTILAAGSVADLGVEVPDELVDAILRALKATRP
jgi:hypothetical protein